MATTTIFINGQEVTGEVEFIRSLLGFGNVSARTESVQTKKSTKTKKTENIPVNNLPFSEDLEPSKAKKTTYSKRGKNGGSFDKFINACIKGEKTYPDDNDIIWKKEVMHIDKIGYLAVLDNHIKRDSYGGLKLYCEENNIKIFDKNGFVFKTKKECQAFMEKFKIIPGKMRLQYHIIQMSSK